MDKKEIINKASAHWSEMSKTTPFPGITRWWQSQRILRHINQLICGKPLPNITDGIIEKIRAHPAWRKQMKGVSIGCGAAVKELSLIEAKIVSSFDCYEISAERVAQGRSLSDRKGLSNSIRYLESSPMEGNIPIEYYDMVYWDNSLHHMLNVDDALAWSKKVLNSGGIIVINDFVGPSRFQWTDFDLSIASQIRALLPERLLVNFNSSGNFFPRSVGRPTIKRMLDIDPTEAADSSSILGCIVKYFPNAEIILLGGVIYHLCLNDILANFQDGIDDALLDLLLLVDNLLTNYGHTHYAFAIATKPGK